MIIDKQSDAERGYGRYPIRTHDVCVIARTGQTQLIVIVR